MRQIPLLFDEIHKTIFGVPLPKNTVVGYLLHSSPLYPGGFRRSEARMDTMRLQQRTR